MTETRTYYDIDLNDYVEVPLPNADALELLLLWAEKEWAKKQAGKPSEWQQGSWASTFRNYYSDKDNIPVSNLCGTTCCIAGKAVQLAGGKLEWMSERFPGEYEGEDDEPSEYVFMPGNGEAVGIRTAASEFLNLTSDEAGNLFHGTNDIESVRTIINELIKKARGANLLEV